MTKLRYTNIASVDAGIKVLTKVGAYTITAADMADCSHLMLHVDGTGASAAYNITMPAVGDFTGKMITFAIVVTTGSSSYKVTIKNSAGSTLHLMTEGYTAGANVTFYSDGTNYHYLKTARSWEGSSL